jgi:hypothetical protein
MAVQEPANFFGRSQEPPAFGWFQIAQVLGDKDLRFHFREVASRIAQSMFEFSRSEPSVSLGNVARDGDGGAPQLRG